MWRLGRGVAIQPTVERLPAVITQHYACGQRGRMHAIRSGQGEARVKGRKPAAWLALFSLFLQLWITAGHFHPEDFASFIGATQAADAVRASTDSGTQPSGVL